MLGAASYNGDGSNAEAKANGGTSFSYNLALNLETSFTGEDMLYTRLRSGNMNNIYGGNGRRPVRSGVRLQLRQRS